MTRTLLVDCLAAETRAALLDNGEILRFWFGPARGDESLPRPLAAGDLVAGRVRAVSAALAAAFIDLGAERDGFLPLKKGARPPVEGERLDFIVRRAAQGAKGPVLDSAPASGRREGECDAVALAVRWARMFGAAIGGAVTNDSEAAMLLSRAFRIAAARSDDPFAESGADDALAAALERSVRLPSGARLVFDETEGVCVVDIDAEAAAKDSSRAVNDRVNAEAATHLFAELARRGIGGRIVVDFLPPSDAAARKSLLDLLSKSASGVFERRIGRLAQDGLFDMTAPRTGPSLLEGASEPAGDHLLRGGRRATRDWAAKSALRTLERGLRARPSARPRLVLGSDLYGYLAQERPQWRQRLEARHGARFTIETRAFADARMFEHVE